MDNKMRLIDANPLIERFSGGDAMKSMSESIHDSIFVETLRNAPTVDAVPVDEIIFHHILIDENGIPEVKLQFGERTLVLRRNDPVDAVEEERCKYCDNTCPGNRGLVCTIWGAGTDPDTFCSFGKRTDDHGAT